MTISPVSWSQKKIAKEFGVTEYMAKVAIQLRSKKGIFAEPAVKKGKPLPQATVEAIKRFYLDDNNSYMRVMPGKKDSVNNNKKFKGGGDQGDFLEKVGSVFIVQSDRAHHSANFEPNLSKIGQVELV